MVRCKFFFDKQYGENPSFRNRACLNFQAFALRDTEVAAQEGFCIGQKMSYRFSFCQLNSACSRGSIYYQCIVSLEQ